MAGRARTICYAVVAAATCVLWYDTLLSSSEPKVNTHTPEGDAVMERSVRQDTPPEDDSTLHSHTLDVLEGDAWAVEQERRHQAVSRACKGEQHSAFQYNLPRNKHGDTLYSLLVDDTHKAIYCFVPKVACTNWKRLWMILSGLSQATDPLEIPMDTAHGLHDKMMLIKQKHSSRVLLGKLKTYTKLLIVRDPYQRLLSAYRDKLESQREEYFTQKYAQDIKKASHKNASDSATPGYGEKVTFSEFVSYIISLPSDAFDEHWRPYHRLCFPCDIQYDVIAKYETLVEDSERFLRLIGAPKHLHFPAFVPSNTSSLLHSYMASLSGHQREALRAIYKKDFQMFQYRDEI